MPVESKPLFRPEALRSKLANFVQPLEAMRAAEHLKRWATNLEGKHGDKFKETEQLPEFLSDIFVKQLGHVGRESGHDHFTFRQFLDLVEQHDLQLENDS